MVKIEAVLHPEEAELVWTMLDHAAKQRSRASVAHSHSAGDSAESPSAGVAAVWQPATRDTSDTAGVASGNGWENSAGVRERLPGDSAESPGAGGTMVWQSAGLGVNDAALTGSNGWGNSAGAREPSVGDSAESCAAPPVDEARSGAAGAAEGAAELASDCSRSGRSLFDRLVDEVRDAEIERAEQAVRDAARAADGSALDSEPELGEKALASAGRRSGLASRAQPGMLQRRAAAASCAFDRADALVSVARAYLHGDQPQRAPIDVTITIPASSLRRDAVDTVDVGCMGSACISAETARRLSCDAGVVEVIEDEQGVPLSVGRKRRTIAGSIKRALLRRDGACTYPGCSNRMFLEGHHIEHWADGGATALDNAALMCSHHHRFVHEYGYTVELGPDRRPQFRDPHGGVVTPVPARHHGGDLGWPQILAANASLAIDADTIACEWDGKPVRYGRVIDDLVAADGLV